jgi:hypothetical protein
MTVLENSVLIERPMGDVFDYAVDMRNELTWNPQCRSMEKITEGPIGLGTKFLAKWKQSPLIEVTCTKFERPQVWEYTNGGPLAVVFEVSLSAQDRGTRLSSRFDVRPHGVMRLFFPVVLRSLRRAEQRNMASIKKALEETPHR